LKASAWLRLCGTAEGGRRHISNDFPVYNLATK
jgi:hypothetical protein